VNKYVNVGNIGCLDSPRHQTIGGEGEMPNRRRLTWDQRTSRNQVADQWAEDKARTATRSKTADPYTLDQTRKEPKAEQYTSGNPSKWAEDQCPNTWSGEKRDPDTNVAEFRSDTFTEPKYHTPKTGGVIDQVLDEESARVATAKEFEYQEKRARVAVAIAKQAFHADTDEKIIIKSAGTLMFLPDEQLAELRRIQMAQTEEVATEEVATEEVATEEVAATIEAVAAEEVVAEDKEVEEALEEADLEEALEEADLELSEGGEEGPACCPECGADLEGELLEGMEPDIFTEDGEEGLPEDLDDVELMDVDMGEGEASEDLAAVFDDEEIVATTTVATKKPVQRLGGTPRVASAGAGGEDLSSLWQSEPDVSETFGTPLSAKK